MKKFDYSRFDGHVDKYGEVYKAPRYKEAEANKFVQNMLAAGFWPYDYHGRWYWKGPAVNVEDLQDAYGATKIKCQRDNMGLGYVVYPVNSATLIEKED